MREIEYRVWDKKRNKMLINYDDQSGPKDEIYADEWDTFLMGLSQIANNPEEYDLMEFVGLRDKGGKKIFEGDIVSVPYVNPIGQLDMATEDHKSIVLFENGGFKLTDYGDNQDISYWQERGQTKYISNYGNVTELLPHTKLTIIGNIYENPDLMRRD
jgi:uncharacterized phage protein (TIGR01671 family)